VGFHERDERERGACLAKMTGISLVISLKRGAVIGRAARYVCRGLKTPSQLFHQPTKAE
jgi:hypothetical protein